MAQKRNKRFGQVYLIGAGPGDPGLITLRGVACLGRADLVLYDYLVDPRVLRHAGDGAELVCLGHHSRRRTVEQNEIHERMIQAAQNGRTVARLKGGDPDVFGKSAEETEALRSAGIPYEIVPGVTAALAAGGYAEIPLTHGDHSSCLAFVTGQERRRKKGPALDYPALAGFPGTLVFYMGIRSAPDWSQALIHGGKSPDTPVAIVRRCTHPDQTVVRCTLGTVADVIRNERVRPPAVTIVGSVAGMGPELSWFAARPLFGRTVLVTRPRHQAEVLCERFSDFGARVLTQPLIEINPCKDWAPVDNALAELDRYDWLVFSSANGVEQLLGRLFFLGRDLRALGGTKLAAIGPGTAEALASWHLNTDLVPEQFCAEALADSLAPHVAERRVLLARASRGRDVLAERLRQAGAHVSQAVVYESTDVRLPDSQVQSALSDGLVDWVTVTSSAIAQSAASLFGTDLGRVKLASISPITSDTLRSLGYEPTAEATDYTMEGVVDAVLRAEREDGAPG
jgi:uroporphyrinogen III methyltransferase / synthase